MNNLYIIDSFALAFRIFYAFSRNPLLNSQGQDTSVVHGYWSNVLRILQLQEPSHIAIVRDMGAQTFRNELYPDYKANRGEMPEEMRAQLPMLEEFLQNSGIPILGKVGFEADDVMASIALRAADAGLNVFLVTKDKDMTQIVSDRIKLFSLEKGREVEITDSAAVEAKFGVKPHQMRDYLALVGDAADNVPGVPKVGAKTAAGLLQEFDNLDNLYENLAAVSRKAIKTSLEENREKAYLSRELVTLQSTQDFDININDLAFKGLNVKALDQLCETYELNALRRQLTRVHKGLDVPYATASALEFSTELVNTPAALEQLEQKLRALPADQLIALDTETDSLVGWQANLVGFSLAWQKDAAYYIPLGHPTDNAPAAAAERILAFVAEPERHLVLHNAKFATQVLQHRGFALQGTLYDTMLAAWVLNPGLNNYSLDAQVQRGLQHTMQPIVDLLGKGKNQLNFAQVNADAAAPYATEAAVAIWALWQVLVAELHEKNLYQVYVEQELPLLAVLATMERQGIAIDSAGLHTVEQDLTARLAKLTDEIYYHAGGQPFNINSPKQLGAVLFEDLLLPTIKKTATGYSTDAAVLEELKGIHPIIYSIIEYRELNKLLNTYVEVLPTLVNAQTQRVHTQFMQTGTATGRLSSREPNLQNIPIRSDAGKKVRAAFVASRPDHVLLSADYSQIELRMLAHLTGDPQLLAAYQQGQDIHRNTAAAIFGIAPESVTAEMRNQAKTVNFGVLYGMTAFRLARDLDISRGDAKKFIDGYFELYAQAQPWMDEVVAQASAQGYVETITGRRRYIPGIDSGDGTERKMAERMAINSPVQGSAADLIKLAMIEIQRRITTENLPLQMLLQVHDELVFECPAEYASTGQALVKEIMESVLKLRVPLVAEVGVGSNWLAAH